MAQTLEDRLRSRLGEAVKQAAGEFSTQVFSGHLVKRLVVAGSFRNDIADDGAVKGFMVKLRNRLGVATVIGCAPLKVDGERFGVELISIEKNGKAVRAAEISERMPLSVSFGDELVVRVDDEQGLEAGRHDIELGLKMVGLGMLRVSYDDALTGEGRPRVRKAQPAEEGAAGDFADVMRRTVEMAAAHVGSAVLAECAKTVSAIVLELDGEKYGVALGADGSAEFTPGAAAGAKVLTISTSKAAFHNMAWNKLNPGIAYARGEIRLEGVPVLKLRGMDPVITAIFRGYRAASEGVEFEEAEAAAGGGVVDEIAGFAISAFDEVLKALDKALAVFGVKFFYEKSLNRLEWVWEILDREVRRMLAFGREAAPAAPAPGKEPAAKPAPAKSLQDRLRERIATAVETVVAEVSRTAVSGYLVKRLVAPGSFRNFDADGAPAGFEVKLKNKLGAATIIGFSDVRVDGEKCDPAAIEITKSGKTLPAAEISSRRPLSVAFGDEMLVRVRRPGGMAPGTHRIQLGVDMVGLGGVDVDYEEKLSV